MRQAAEAAVDLQGASAHSSAGSEDPACGEQVHPRLVQCVQGGKGEERCRIPRLMMVLCASGFDRTEQLTYTMKTPGVLPKT